MTHTVTINVDGESYDIDMVTPAITINWKFNLGEETELQTPDGMKTVSFWSNMEKNDKFSADQIDNLNFENFR